MYSVPNFLEESFDNNFSFTDKEGTKIGCYVFEVGQLKISTGKIVASDPLMYEDYMPFTPVFPNGNFPVQLAVGKVFDDERVAFARIKFSDNKPAKWEMATCAGQNTKQLSADEIFGYGVDSGTGGFMDVAAVKEFSKFTKKEGNEEAITDSLDQNYKDTWNWLLWEGTAGNVALFSSGWGDGVYATYIGYDANNTICRLVTDFCVLE